MNTSQTSEKLFYNLIFCLSGPYGSGCSRFAKEMHKIVNDWPGCIPEIVKVTKIIKDLYDAQKRPSSEDKIDLGDSLTAPIKRKNYQRAGTQLRVNFSQDIIGKAIAQRIYDRGIEIENTDSALTKNVLVFIVDSLKNNHDLNALRNIYRDECLFIYITANHEVRWRRLRDYKSWKEDDRPEFEDLDDIDNSEKDKEPSVGEAGQEVGKLASFADYYVVNNQNIKDLIESGKRLFNLVLGSSMNQPTIHERSMHLAFSASMRSFCLSRQVGAAIVDRGGNVISVGYNDVPKAKGGLYTQEDELDRRCYQVGDRRCINDNSKERIFKEIMEEIKKRIIEENIDDTSIDDPSDSESLNPAIDEILDKIDKTLKGSRFKDATEYCRAVHAEMEALLACCRTGARPVAGASIYVTTKPCHNCTKHIICAGIEKVIYIEPYPKSLAQELHSDAATFDIPKDAFSLEKKVAFIPYEGVAPQNYYAFFRMTQSRKNDDGYFEERPKEEKANRPGFEKGIYRRSRNNVEKMIKNRELSEETDTITLKEMAASKYVRDKLVGGNQDE